MLKGNHRWDEMGQRWKRSGADECVENWDVARCSILCYMYRSGGGGGDDNK